MARSKEERHALELAIRLQRRWFQDKPRHPHDALAAARRQAALSAGAIAVTDRALLMKRYLAFAAAMRNAMTRQDKTREEKHYGSKPTKLTL